MRKATATLAVALAVFAVVAWTRPTPQPAAASGQEHIRYTADGKLEFPTDYREWVFLSSGLDMTYGPLARTGDMHMFDNVWVNPESYRHFLANGKWPDKTIFILEVRGAVSKGSINQHGQFQSAELMGIEAHVKDAKFDGGWAFFGFDGQKPGTYTPKTASCYSCHEKNAAVDTTFVQFYPTLIEIAKAKGTYKE